LKESTSLLRKHEQSDSKRLGVLQFRWMKTDFVMEAFDTFLIENPTINEWDSQPQRRFLKAFISQK
jgi:hypothetical protein